ncbi:MAG: precorrin-3B C(17)-methyltransferase [Lachnospiraceae bacterium]
MKRIYVIGIGPGAYEQMTIGAVKRLEQCDIIIGYTVYIDLVKEHFPGKVFLSTPMKQEVKRCHMACEEAMAGKQVAMICSGDAGIYGMAGLMYETAHEYEGIQVEVVPGITAASAGAAILGAPLNHDFAVISLSDLLTPWEKIEQRLASAAKGDFAICLYNPSSKKRKDYLERACAILLADKHPDTVCGIVRNIGREGETISYLSLEALQQTSVDMFTTVFIGNKQTVLLDGKMVTPRGYHHEA